jgi:cell division protein FtsI (penicillin-binding protein 3)
MEQPPLPALSKSQERALLVGLILLGWALIVVFRLFMLQVLGHDEYVRQAQQQQERLVAVEAPRGAIYDRNGSLLAISSASHSLIVNPKRMADKAFDAVLLGSILNMNVQQLQTMLQTAAASKHHSGFLVVNNHLTAEQAEGLRGLKIDWLEVRQGSVRNYPNGALAAHVIGNINSAGSGTSGVELKLNKDLAGTPGSMRVERDGKDESYQEEIVKTPSPGRNIGLTIDRELQYVAQEALRQAVVQNHADHGSLVAVNPKTGEILALENYPTYDLNEHLLPGEKPKGREDLAVVAPFEPGSVFKVVTVSAAMETTHLTPDSMINCGNGVMKLFSRVIHDSHPHGDLSVSDVLAKSSNIGAIKIGMQVGNQNLYEYVRRFGFGKRTGIELPSEAPGMLRPLKKWQPTSIGSVPMGHEISVTSLQLAQMGSVIANGGYLVRPHILAWRQTPGGQREEAPRPAPQQILQPRTVELMRAMMRKVVLPGGTASQLHIPGYAIAGKTGTAQIYDYAHRVYTHKYNASFMGFAPYDNPSILVVVTVSGTTGQAGFGGAASGPVFVKVMQTALQRLAVVRDAPEEIDELIAKENAKNKSAEPVLEQDDVSLADNDNQLTAEEIKEALGPDAGLSGATADADPDAPKVPNFVGKTVQDVMQEAAADGLEVVMLGSGLARTQTPSPGASLMPGERIRVRFTR